ncbi:putative conidiation-specific protein (con-13) protein [Paramyrothecium foliicola]|nr:putative conidiation-specific protein (con-13) protein [Paramyrothecium foliicola]
MNPSTYLSRFSFDRVIDIITSLAMSAKIFSVGGILAGLCTLSQAQRDPITFPAINPEYDGGIMDNNMRALPVPYYDVEQWAPGYVPRTCFDDTWLEPIHGEDMEVYTVTYGDCEEPTIICRHKNTPASPGSIFHAVGRLRGSMRQWAGNFVAIPSIRPEIAWQTGPTIVVSDNHWDSPTLMIHEILHAIDLMKLGSHSNWEWWSTILDGPFRRAVIRDQHVATGYARSNHIEALAEAGKHLEYNNQVPGGLAALSPAYQDIQVQMDYISAYMAQEFHTDRCNGKVPSSPPVHVAAALARGAKLGPKPDVTITKVPEIHVHPVVYKVKPFCNATL